MRACAYTRERNFSFWGFANLFYPDAEKRKKLREKRKSRAGKIDATQKLKMGAVQSGLSLRRNQNQIAMNMNSQKICDILSIGTSITIASTPYSLTQLRKMAKAAQRGNCTLTLTAHDELTLNDIENIVEEAPRHVALNLLEYPQG